jgi:transcriptional regulator with XRE-family HTH domain
MFYNNLKLECDRQNLRITNIVAECGGAKGSISNWKKGVNPNSDMVVKLASRLNVTTDYLLFGIVNEPQKEITAVERDLLDHFGRLDDYQKGYIMGELKQMVQARG